MPSRDAVGPFGTRSRCALRSTPAAWPTWVLARVLHDVRATSGALREAVQPVEASRAARMRART